MAICRKLGCRYLWIDSLCIIQDSESDWLKEGVDMFQIYRNSFCNIAAMKAVDGRDGCFSLRDSRLGQLVTFRMRWKDQSSERLNALWDMFYWKHHVKESVLTKRAWIVQEMILSPRMLIFGENEIFWACNRHSACETFPDGMPFGQDSILSDEAFLSAQRRPAYMDFDLWKQTVETYSAASLTFPSKDKLLAVSGIAKCMKSFSAEGESSEGSYMAGLWTRTFVRELLWRCRDGFDYETSRGRPLVYQAPTWSWASLNQAVEVIETFPWKQEHVVMALLDVSVGLLVTSEQFGPVTSGCARVSAPLRELREGVDDCVINFPTTFATTSADDEAFSKCFLSLDSAPPDEVPRLYMAGIVMKGADDPWKTMYGLILRRVTGAEYQRCGLWSFCEPFEIADIVKLFDPSCNGIADDMHVGSSREENFGLVTYSISLV